jgi:hypothetical protein
MIPILPAASRIEVIGKEKRARMEVPNDVKIVARPPLCNYFRGSAVH